jgi:hypothetical protein
VSVANVFRQTVRLLPVNPKPTTPAWVAITSQLLRKFMCRKVFKVILFRLCRDGACPVSTLPER